MGFFKNLKRRTRKKMAPVAPVQPIPIRKPQMIPRKPEALPPLKGPRNQGIPGLMNRIPQMPTRESITNFVKENVDFSRLPRMMLAEGRDANIVDFLNADPEQVIFGIDVELDKLDLELEQAQKNNDRDAIDMIGDEMNDLMFERIKLSNISGDRQYVDDYASALDDTLDMKREAYLRKNADNERRLREILGERGRTISNMDMRMGRTLSNRGREILGERGRTLSNLDRDSLDDILSALEKKN